MEHNDLSEPKLLFETGHTLSLTQFKDSIYGFLGQVGFEKIEVYKGKDLFTLEKVCVLEGCRWGSAISFGGKIRLYFTRQSHRLPHINPYLFQTIYSVDSTNGLDYSSPQKVVDGSAPFICNLEGYPLLFHKRFPHRILLNNQVIINSFKVLSAPSLVYVDGSYLLTCEARSKKVPWHTVLYESKDLKHWKLTDNSFLEGPCAFQHMMNGKYVVTYSVPNGKNWQIMMREMAL